MGSHLWSNVKNPTNPILGATLEKNRRPEKDAINLAGKLFTPRFYLHNKYTYE